MVEGLRFVMTGRRIIIFLTITASLYTFATSAFTTLFPVFARTLLDLGPVEVGYLWSMLGVGLLSVSVALTIISAWSIKRRIKVIAFASAMSGLVLLALVKTNQPTSAAVLLMLLGAGLGVLTPVAWGVLQEVAPAAHARTGLGVLYPGCHGGGHGWHYPVRLDYRRIRCAGCRRDASASSWAARASRLGDISITSPTGLPNVRRRWPETRLNGVVLG